MNLIEILGYISALLIGISLGLIGGGGSILTVPVLVYLFGIEPVLATAYSLFVVGVTSFFGSLGYMKQGLLHYKMAIVFAIPAFMAVFTTRNLVLPNVPDLWKTSLGNDFGINMIFAISLILGVIFAALLLLKVDLKKEHPSLLKIIVVMAPAAIMVFVVRQWVIPNLPENILQYNSLVIHKNMAIMVLFAVVMAVASWSMIRKGKGYISKDVKGSKINLPMITLEGLLVGSITGLVGAGGGFLIIPALVVLAKLPMKLAVGTSLLIITVKSLIGFLGDLSHQTIDWTFLLCFSAISISGIFIGIYVSPRIEGEKLKKGFGWFVLFMAVVILGKQFL